MRRRPYQDMWRNGRLVRKGRRECANRYDIIKKALVRQFGTEGWSLADIGGWDGYFARRFSEDLGVVCTLIEPRKVDLSRTSVHHLQTKMTARTARTLAPYDAVLILSVLHHMPDWEQVLAEIKSRCVWLVLELAVPAEATDAAKAIPGADRLTAPTYQHVMEQEHVPLGMAPGPNGPPRPLVMIRCAARGTVEPGSGAASRIMNPADFKALGYEPFPGTLNIKVSKGTRNWFKRQGGLRIPSRRSDDQYVPARIDGLDDVPVHVSFSRNKWSLELLSPVRLREYLSDGDIVKVRPCE